jgi:glycosyltransferase involved in cell wall biosynthesis
MRFVHILVGSGDPHTVSGVNKVVHWLATTQTAMGISSEVWALKANGAEASHERNYPMRVFTRTRSRFLLSRELRSQLEQLSAGAWVQLHSVYIPELAAIARLLKRRGISYGVTPHGGYQASHFDPSRALRIKKAAFSALWENWMLRNAAMIQVVGMTELEDLKRRAPGQKMAMIPNGYSAGRLLILDGDQQEARSPSMMYCGRLEIRQKGLDLLLRGYAAYRREGGKLNLVLIGGGKDAAHLRTLAHELGVAESVSWPGVLYGDELRSMLRGAAAFVHTSRFEGLPMACLEAAALGLPLFVSRETNFAEYILPRNAGWVCWPNVPEKIAETMFLIEQTSPSDRLAMGKNARQIIDEELRWETICERLEKTVRESMTGA